MGKESHRVAGLIPLDPVTLARAAVYVIVGMSVLYFAYYFIIADLTSRGLSPDTIRKFELLRDELTSLLPGIRVDRVTADELGRLKEGWKVRPSTAIKRLERLRSFFKFSFISLNFASCRCVLIQASVHRVPCILPYRSCSLPCILPVVSP